MKITELLSQIKSRGVPLAFAAVLFLGVAGCATQHTQDEKIYKVSGLGGTNYYRVRIISSAVNGKAFFKAALYPAFAVDLYRGQDVDVPSELIDVEDNMRKEVAQAQTNALHIYLNAQTDEDRITAAKRLREVQEIPVSSGGGMIGTNRTVEMQFNPVKSLVDYRANKKFVIALSSDPDEILNQIGAFVEEAKTTDTIQDAITAQLSGIGGTAQLQARAALFNSLIDAMKEEAARTDVDNASKLNAVISKLKTATEGLQ
jgi:hypothetical protein